MTQQDTQPPAETLAENDTRETIIAAITKADASFGYSYRLTKMDDTSEEHTLFMDGFEPAVFKDREDGYPVIEQRRNAARTDAILAALARRAGGDAIPNSWARSAEDTRAMALLLAEVELHLQSSRIFITTREKMHPCGVDLHDELAAKVTAALDNIGRENGDARR